MSGCILGWCPICEIEVSEGEWSGDGFERYEIFIHPGECYEKFKLQTIERRLIRKQSKEIRELRDEIERLTIDNIDLIKNKGAGKNG